jgi:hypothetical protein
MRAERHDEPTLPLYGEWPGGPLERTAALLFAVPLMAASSQGMDHATLHPAASAGTAQKLRTAMDQLWEDHIVYARNLIDGIAKQFLPRFVM